MKLEIESLSPKQKFVNVLLLSFSFMLVFTGFQTCGMVEETVLNSYINQTSVDGTSSFKGDGYTSLAIMYTVFAFANWLAPSVVSIIGPKLSMVIGAAAYVLYLASFIKPLTGTLYAGSVIIGFGGAFLWTGQGNLLTINSTKETIARNSGLFWAIFQSSFLIGNLYVFFAWKGVETITDKQRIPLFIGLTAVSTIGIFCMLFLTNTPKTQTTGNDDDKIIDATAQTENDDAALLDSHAPQSKAQEAYKALVESFKLFKTRDMALLSVTFFYTGLELTFAMAVYSTSVGATKQFGSDSDKLVGLVGIMVGIGEIVGSFIFGIFGHKTIKYGRDMGVLLGGVGHAVTFFLIFLNLPADSPISRAGTMDTGYITPNSELVIFCGFLLGFCDACFNTQCLSIIGGTYPDQSAAAFALFNFSQCLAAAIGFFYSSYLTLPYQLLILVVFDFAGMITFVVVERGLQYRDRVANSYPDIPS